MKKLLLTLILLLPVFCSAQKQVAGKIYHLIIGTRTRGNSNGIYVYRFNTVAGSISPISHVDNISDPTYVYLANNNKLLYAVSDKATGPGSIYAYSFDAAKGTLQALNNQRAFGGPLYITADKALKNLFVANYLGGTLAVYPLNPDGSLQPASQTIHGEGSSINKERQEGPHTHTAVLSPDEKYLLATDLGTDKLNIYNYDPSKPQPLTPAKVPFVISEPGSGPRHLDFSIDGKFVYLLHELTGTITTYKYHDGSLTPLQTISMLTADFKGAIQAADIHVSPDGRFLYASNRGDANEIIQFAIDKKNGMLTLIDRYSSMGKSPRNFVIDPSGSFMLISNQYSNNVFVYRIDAETGRLRLTDLGFNIDFPMCIRFAPAGLTN